METKDFFNYLKYEKRYSNHTLTAYEGDLTQFILFLDKTFEIKNLLEAKHIHLRSWMVSLMEEKISARSINRKMSALKTFYKFQLRKSAIGKDPMYKLIAPKIARRLPVFIQQKQVEKMWDLYEFGNDFTGICNKIIMELFYSTGIRVSELVNLKDNSFDRHNSALKVIGKGNKERIIPLNKEMNEMLKKFIQLRDSTFQKSDFSSLLVDKNGRKLYSRSVYRIVNATLQRISTVEKKSPHVLRHTFATHMLNNGAEINAIKELLGHSSLAATQVYTHNTIDKLKDIYEKAHPKAHND